MNSGSATVTFSWAAAVETSRRSSGIRMKVFFMVLLVFMIRFLKAEHIKNAG